VYILIPILLLVIVAVLIFFLSRMKSKKKFSQLMALAFAFIVAGIIGEDRLVGYSLLGIGGILPLVDMYLTLHSRPA
jgi:hypothetical protein